MAVTLKGYTANYLGLSTDAKPTEADDNAIFRELDTGKRYYFTGAAWAEIPSSGGGGGSDVTSVNGKTGAVVLSASDVGAYTTTEANTLLCGKADKVSGASAGDLAGLDANGNLTDSGINAAVIPSTASTSNKLSTAADTAGEDITATANSEDIALTDSADARVHDLKIYGKTENGHSVGENGLTVTAVGKNVLGPYDLRTGYNNSKDGVSGNTATYNGTTLNVDGKNVYITVEQQREVKITFTPNLILEPNETYVLAIKVNKELTGNQRFVVKDDTTGTTLANIGEGMLVNTVVGYSFVKSNSNPVSVYYYASTGGTTDILAEIMVCKYSDFQLNNEIVSYISNNISIVTALPLRRKMLTADLGNFDWTYDEESTYESGTVFHRFVSSTKAPGMFDPTRWTKKGISAEDAYLLATESCSSRYTVSNSAGAHDPVTDKTIIMGRDGTIYVIDNSYTDPAEFKAAVTGITLTYPSYCDEIDLADGVATTRLDSNGDVLATPVVTPLTTAEKAAFAEFRTFDGNTNVTATDDPFMSLNYVRNTDNGKALADVDNRIEETFTATEKAKLAGIATGATANTVIDTTCTLTVAGWTGNAAPYTQTVNVTNVLSTDKAWCDLSVSSTVATGLDEIDDWSLISKIESGAGTLTFSCYEEKPTTELNVNVKVVR